MAIKIKRKPNTRLSWEANALFRASFPLGEDVFEIPNINWMVYLYKSFDLIEATDENGNDINLSSVMSCCKGSIKLEVTKEEKEADRVLNKVTHDYIKEADIDTDINDIDKDE